MKHLRKEFLFALIVIGSVVTPPRAPAATFPANSGTITHRYFPVTSGMVFSYSGYGEAAGATLTYRAVGLETIDGRQTIKMLRQTSGDYDHTLWLAQDTDGNIWQLRSFDAHPQGGYDETDSIYLPGHFSLGMKFIKEGDEYTVLSLSAATTTPLQTFTGCAQVRVAYDVDVSEDTYFAPGYGVVRIVFLELVSSGLQVTSITGHTPPTPTSFLLGGEVRMGTASGPGFGGVSISLNPAAGTTGATSTATGAYAFGNVPAGTYTVTPSYTGYSFSPASRTVVLNAVTSDVSFVGNTNQLAPQFSLQPVARTVIASNSATFTVTATGTPAPTMLWQRKAVGAASWSNLANGGAYSGVTTATLTVAVTTVAMSGDEFRCLATNGIAPDATSNAVALTVNTLNQAPEFSSQPADRTITTGQTTTFVVVATGSPVPTVQWQIKSAGSTTWSNLANAGAYGGVTNATLTITGATLGMSGDQFRCLAANGIAPDATSNAATLVVNLPEMAPQITLHPDSISVRAGENVAFHGEAIAQPAPAYQWQRLPVGGAWTNIANGGAYSGATTVTLTVSSVTASMDGEHFRFIASNGVNPSQSSLAAALTVVTGPAITAQPVDVTVSVGGYAILSVSATGTGLTYQWRHLGSAVPGATTATLTLNNVQLDDAGFYDVVVSDGLASIASRTAKVTVAPAQYPSALRLKAGFDPRFELDGGIPYAVAVAADQRIYAAGMFSSIDHFPCLRLARFSADGVIDRTFAPATIQGGPVRAMLLLPDGGIVIAGDFMHVAGVSRAHIARLKSDGSLDTSFDPGAGFNGTVHTLAHQSDGMVLAGGAFSTCNTVSCPRIARLTESGALDVTFAPVGTGFLSGFVQSVAIQSDGKVVVAGTFTNYNGMTASRIARLTSDGALDPTFSTGSGFDNTVYALALQTDGQILAGGTFAAYNGTGRNRVARLDTSGAIDTGFSSGTGLSNASAFVTALAVLDNGKVVASGWRLRDDSTAYVGVACLEPDGQPSTSYRNDAATNGEAWSIAVQSDGRIVAGGAFFESGTMQHGLVRLAAGGTDDMAAGSQTWQPGEISSVVPAGNRKWIIGGRFNYVDGAVAKTARSTPRLIRAPDSTTTCSQSLNKGMAGW